MIVQDAQQLSNNACPVIWVHAGAAVDGLQQSQCLTCIFMPPGLLPHSPQQLHIDVPYQSRQVPLLQLQLLIIRLQPLDNVWQLQLTVCTRAAFSLSCAKFAGVMLLQLRTKVKNCGRVS